MENLRDVLGKAFEISTKQIFNVRILDDNKKILVNKSMTYLELGTYLTHNCDTIRYITINIRE